MPYSALTYASSLIAKQDSGVPMFLSSNVLRSASSNDVRWSSNGSYTSNLGTVFAPVSGLWDDAPWVASAPRLDSSQRYDVIAPLSNAHDGMDTVFYVLLSPPVFSGTASFTVSVANDSSGSPGTWVEIHSEQIAQNERRKIVYLENGGSLGMYLEVDWLRISWVGLSEPPQVGQLVVGLRRLMTSWPNRPYDSQATYSTHSEIVSEYGASRKYTLERGFFQAELEFSAVDFEKAVGKSVQTSPLDELRSVWAESDYGENVVVYIHEGKARVCWIQNTPDFSVSGPFLARPKLVLQELPPYEATDG